MTRVDPYEIWYQLDLTAEELIRAPSLAADKDFDWGDRSQEIVMIHF